MGRRPEVFVRAGSMAEGQRLQRISRTAKDPVKLRRAIVVLMSAQSQPTPDIAHLLVVTEDYVRDVIHAFNDRGFDALDPRWSGAHPRKTSRLLTAVAVLRAHRGAVGRSKGTASLLLSSSIEVPKVSRTTRPSGEMTKVARSV